MGGERKKRTDWNIVRPSVEEGKEERCSRRANFKWYPSKSLKRGGGGCRSFKNSRRERKDKIRGMLLLLLRGSKKEKGDRPLPLYLMHGR